jgi:hypothetical protein
MRRKEERAEKNIYRSLSLSHPHTSLRAPTEMSLQSTRLHAAAAAATAFAIKLTTVGMNCNASEATRRSFISMMINNTSATKMTQTFRHIHVARFLHGPLCLNHQIDKDGKAWLGLLCGMMFFVYHIGKAKQ